MGERPQSGVLLGLGVEIMVNAPRSRGRAWNELTSDVR